MVKTNSGILKSIKDSQNYVPNTLNPEFYRYYELDASLPLDWRFTLSLHDHRLLLRDSLIGQTEIDIEDRFYANSNRLISLVLKE
jgi:hypothetical protein